MVFPNGERSELDAVSAATRDGDELFGGVA